MLQTGSLIAFLLVLVWFSKIPHPLFLAGQQLKCLTVIDEFTHECLAIDVAGSVFTSPDVAYPD